MSEQSHRDRTVSDLRRMFERAENGARFSALRGAPGPDDARTLKDALHYLGADALVEKASALKRTADPTANALIEAMLPQLLLVLIQRLGGSVRVPVDEIDATGGLVMRMAVEARGGVQSFRFIVERKS